MAVGAPWAGLGADVADLLTDLATVYARAAAPPRRHTVVARAGLPCLLTPISRAQAQSGDTRDDLAGRRSLFWRGDYELPADVQIAVNGRPERWGVVGRVTPLPAGANQPELYQAELVQQTV